MSIVFDHQFTGVDGTTFTGDAGYTNVAGTAPTYQPTANGSVKALRFAANQGIIAENFSGTTRRVFSRIYKLSAACTATSEVCQTRSAGSRGPAIAFTSTNTIRLLRANGSSAASGSVQLPLNVEFRVTFMVDGLGLTAVIFPNTSSTTPIEMITGTSDTTVTMVSCRDGIITAGTLGSGTNLDMSWPVDDDTAEPGPRNYAGGGSGSSTIVMSNNFNGQTGATFAGDSVYSLIAGRAPTYQRAVHQKSLYFLDENQGIIEETFSGTTSRVFSRIYKLSAAVTATSEIGQARVGGSRGPSVTFTSGNVVRILRTDGSSLTTGTVQLPVNIEFRLTFTIINTAVSISVYPNITSTAPIETINGTLSSAVTMTAFREGIITATALGSDVGLYLSWPMDDSATDPGPRSYPVEGGEPPQANAGLDQFDIEPWSTVSLVGIDVEETNPITARTWTQTGGTAVVLSGSGGVRTYQAPATINGETLTFNYSVTAEVTVTDSVSHTILPVNERAVIDGVEVPMNIILA